MSIKKFLLKLPLVSALVDDALAIHIQHYESQIKKLNEEIVALKQKLKKYGA